MFSLDLSLNTTNKLNKRTKVTQSRPKLTSACKSIEEASECDCESVILIDFGAESRVLGSLHKTKTNNKRDYLFFDKEKQ